MKPRFPLEDQMVLIFPRGLQQIHTNAKQQIYYTGIVYCAPARMMVLGKTRLVGDFENMDYQISKDAAEGDASGIFENCSNK